MTHPSRPEKGRLSRRDYADNPPTQPVPTRADVVTVGIIHTSA
ncbi:hypothetical protein SAMN02745244_02578 [Tessaracoccus bendigoensis DSM 12906]|uniref:Uncharacterized protein n=1 Tax=Tessaracoccus bendigoensis DSM 12906 TaxID=1123357 RepID=A0A1M6JIP5_9ACTN|nr:hypothetical protein SAMN02745244_02578 [Tessaracoccus bendigoensis DSM 12906]